MPDTMNEQTRAFLVTEFESLNGKRPCACVDCGCENADGLADATAEYDAELKGWLQAHEASDMAKDAERYRWLRSHFENSHFLMWMAASTPDFGEDEVDAAIDASIGRGRNNA